jgi:hypothetical protein
MDTGILLEGFLRGRTQRKTLMVDKNRECCPLHIEHEKLMFNPTSFS